MKVQFRINSRFAPILKVFSSAHADALKMQSHAKLRTCSKTQVRAWVVPRSSAHIAEHVLAGATDLLGAGRDQKTQVDHRNRKSFGHTTSKQELTTRHV